MNVFFQICEIMKNESNWVGGWDEEGHVPFGCYSNNWVGFENPRSVQDKVDFVIAKEYGGRYMDKNLDLNNYNYY